METSHTRTVTGAQEGPDAVVVRIGRVSAEALSPSEQSERASLEGVLEQAVRYYLGPVRGATGWAYPKFLEFEPPLEPPIKVGLGRRSWDDLVGEAELQGVEPDSLLQHVVMFYGAARDAGRLTAQTAERLDGDDEVLAAG